MKYMFLSMSLIGLLVIPCVANALDTDDDDLLLYLPFNGDVQDYSKHGNHGEIVGTTTFVDGKIEQALEFSGAGEVRAPYIPLNNKSFTVCLWIRPELSGGEEQVVFSQNDTQGVNLSLHYRIYNNGTVRMGFYTNDMDAPGAVEAGKWAHLCFWLDVEGTSRKIYIDGVEVKQDAGVNGIEYKGAAGDTVIGMWTTRGQYFNGVIDEVQVWDRALTEEEILQSTENITLSAVDASGKLTATWGSLKAK